MQMGRMHAQGDGCFEEIAGDRMQGIGNAVSHERQLR